MAPHMKDVVCGKVLDHDTIRNSAFGVYEYGPEKFVFCSKECKEGFDKDPPSYYVKLILFKHEAFRDPVCAREMVHDEAVKAFPMNYSIPNTGFGASKHKDSQFFFHAEPCKKSFDADPERYYQDWVSWRNAKTKEIEERVRSEGAYTAKHLPGFDPDRDGT